jgi:hypothetical protein
MTRFATKRKLRTDTQALISKELFGLYGRGGVVREYAIQAQVVEVLVFSLGVVVVDRQ